MTGISQISPGKIEEGKNYCKTECQRTGKVFSWCYFRNRTHDSQTHNLTDSLLLKQSPTSTKYMDLHLKQYLGLLSPINNNRFTLQQYCKKKHNHLPNSTKLSKIPRKPCCTVLCWLAAACYFQCNFVPATQGQKWLHTLQVVQDRRNPSCRFLKENRDCRFIKSDKRATASRNYRLRMFWT